LQPRHGLADQGQTVGELMGEDRLLLHSKTELLQSDCHF
jgi:hypothetical protein